MVRWNPRLSLGRRAAWVGAGCLIATALYLLPGRGDIAPVVADDNAYIFLAADHLYAGEGLTSLPPVAPLQPWEYTTDWAWLTQWPFGYPVLLCVVRGLLGVGTVQAAQIINVAACALALLGWFAFLRRSLPRGILGCLLSLVGAGSSVSVAMLINPSTDVLLVALVPCVLIGVQRIVAGPTDRASENQVDPNTPAASGSQIIAPWVAVGAAAGGLVWFRYAAVFVPIALTLYLGVEVFLARRRRLTDLAGLWAGAALPILVLLLVNASQGTASSVQASVNLGTRIGFDFSPAMLVTAWQRWTDVGFYDYKWYSGLFFAIAVPCVPILLALLSRDYRRRVLEFMAAASYISGAALVASLFSVVMLCSTLFQAKFNFVDLERYYLPIRPLYFLLVVGPLLLLRP
ncbi:MAG: hypothetical protein ACE5EX_12605, partial [Phycisphaerae bacterium]